MRVEGTPGGGSGAPVIGGGRGVEESALPGLPQLPGVTHHVVTVNGVRIHYAEAGQGEPLLLLHGFPQNWYMWRDLIPELAKHYRVLAPDTKGAGWSEAPAPGRGAESGYGKAQLADDAAAFLDAVGAPRARVMGHDWGGWIGFQLALRHPEKVRQYVALSIATPWPGDGALAADFWRLAYQPVLAAPVLGAALLRQPTFVRAMLHAAARHDRWTPAQEAAFTGPYRDPAHAAAGSAMYRTFLASELLPWARGEWRTQRLEPQTLLLVGDHDAVIKPGLVAGYERFSRDMRAEFVPDAGHFLPEEQPQAVLDRVLPFFAAG